MAALGIVGGEAVRAVADEATARLERAIANLAGASNGTYQGNQTGHTLG